MMLLKVSTAATRVFALSAAGLTVNIKLSKNGAALADPSAGAGNLTEIGRGLYKFALTTTDTNTAGSLAYALTDAATNTTIYTPPDSQDNVVTDLPGGTVNVTQIAGSATAATNLANSSAAFETGTAQGGGASTITLRAGASATDNLYKYQVVFIISGTGAGQTNKIVGYVGSTQVATVETAWATAPDNTSVYFVLGRVG